LPAYAGLIQQMVSFLDFNKIKFFQFIGKNIDKCK
jgi:hypothetical protein